MCNHNYDEIEYNLNRNWLLKKCLTCGNITSEIINYNYKKLLRVMNND